MAQQPVYVVRTTQNPTVAYNVTRTEYERLIELNILASLDLVFTPPDPIVIRTTELPGDFVGQIWFNPTVAGP